MLVEQIRIENYKSLRDLTFSPKSLTIITGANASGKSNLADSIDFISEVYRHGLEVAVGRKGGYENIAHRKQRRSKGAISVDISTQFELGRPWKRAIERDASQKMIILARHRFAFRAKSRSIKADFEIEEEVLELRIQQRDKVIDLATLHRKGTEVRILLPSEEFLASQFPDVDESMRDFYFGLGELQIYNNSKRPLAASQLIIGGGSRFYGILSTLIETLGNIRVYQVSPSVSRGFSAPTPRPELDKDGANLPTVVDLIQKKQFRNWERIMQTMTRILPDLVSINVDYTTSKTLGLFFQEKNSSRPWSIGEVSDGTIQTLALLVAIFDPSSTLLFLEEPENSVHPWIIKHLLGACAEASKQKQIIITTHSPTVMNYVPPEQVWVIWRSRGESHLLPLLSFDEDFKRMWENGEVSTFDYLDSGAVLEAVPPGPSSLD